MARLSDAQYLDNDSGNCPNPVTFKNRHEMKAPSHPARNVLLYGPVRASLTLTCFGLYPSRQCNEKTLARCCFVAKEFTVLEPTQGYGTRVGTNLFYVGLPQHCMLDRFLWGCHNHLLRISIPCYHFKVCTDRPLPSSVLRSLMSALVFFSCCQIFCLLCLSSIAILHSSHFGYHFRWHIDRKFISHQFPVGLPLFGWWDCRNKKWGCHQTYTKHISA